MPAPLTALDHALHALGLTVNPGQPLVLAFTSQLELRESATLDRIRAELRGLGAALFLVGETRVFSFRPDDEIDFFGARLDAAPCAVAALRTACGFEPNDARPHQLRLALLSGDGHIRSRLELDAADGQQALAEGLTAAGLKAIAAPPSPLLSRREVVLVSLVGAFALLALDGCRSPAPSAGVPAAPTVKKAQTRKITLNVNGQPRELEIEPRVSLLDALRERLGLTGSKKGCDHGQCGACTVLVDGRRVNACLTLAIMVGQAPVTTIEGLASGDALHPMQEAFVAEDALQCGYCTPGQIMSAVGLVRENRAHTDAEVREHMSGNICRCGAYTNIVAAIQKARTDTAPG